MIATKKKTRAAGARKKEILESQQVHETATEAKLQHK